MRPVADDAPMFLQCCTVVYKARDLLKSPPYIIFVLLSWVRVLVTAAVPPARPPPFLPFGAVEGRLAQLLVDIVVRSAQPLTKILAAACLHGLLLHVLLEVLGADPAGIQLGKEFEEASQVILLRCCRCFRIGRGNGV